MNPTTTRTHALSGLLSLALLVAPATAWSVGPDDEAPATQTPAPASEEAPPEVIGEVVVEATPEPEPAKRTNDHTFGEKTYDALVLRPFDFLGLVGSSVAFLPAAILTAPNGRYEVETAYDVLIAEPAENVFERELGRF